MGKRIVSRARGKGGPRYKSPGHRFVGSPEYPAFPATGTVTDIVHDPGRSAPLACVDVGGKNMYMIASEGMRVGDKISFGRNGKVARLGDIEEGTTVYAIENRPGSGPKFCRSAGTFAILLSKIEGKAYLKMPSGNFRFFDADCLATIGKPAGGGRKAKPFVKAGQKFYAMSARNKLWPKTSGVSMNAVDHPFGGRTKPGIPKSVSRHAPPGKKVGDIAPKRTGRKKA